MFEERFGEGPFVFRLNDNGSGPELLSQVCLERGWKEYNPTSGDQWNLWWRTSGFSVGYHRNLYSWQFINHIPKGSAICRKDNLARYLRCMRRVHGTIYDFSPHGYNLPLEYTKLAAECSRTKQSFKDCDENADYFEDTPVWICKPVGQSQGRGIFLFRKLSELTYDTNTIVQRYIERPLLIGGYKFDLRLYVCIPSYHPMTIYMYREGLARFGTDKFTLNDLRNPFRHLTNSSINKLGPGYGEMKERIGSGCKWSLSRLRSYFQQSGIPDWLLWQQISALIILTIVSYASQVPPTVNCFEFFGFDVLIDNALRPWLLEVNLSPALGNDCVTDWQVKKPMLHDMFDLLGFPVHNTGLSIFNMWTEEGNARCGDERKEDAMKEKAKLTVLQAASKWRKRRKSSVESIKDKVSSATRRRRRAPSLSSESVLPKMQTVSITLKCKASSPADVKNEWKKQRGVRKWGNGVDWKHPPSGEGDWVRTWPLRPENSDSKEKCGGGVKEIVAQMTKFSKTARELSRKHASNVSECQLNEFLQSAMQMETEVWIPPRK